MDEIRILKHARFYMSAMSEGINPLTGEYAPPGDTISQERIQKCCAYVVEQLDKLIVQNGSASPRKLPFSITPQQAAQVQLSQTPIGVNDLAKRINAVTAKNMRNITGQSIAKWLANNGYLSQQRTTEEVVKMKKVPNERSSELGITLVKVTGPDGGTYDKLLYSEKAQRFVLGNINSILSKKDEE